MNDQMLNIKFVGEVEKRPVLYNYTLCGYSWKDVTEKAWGEVAEEVGITVAESKEKWKNLRAVFIRHKKREKNGSGVKSKKPYYLSEAMQFALPYVKALSKTPENLPNELQEKQHEIFDDGCTNDVKLESQSSASTQPCPAPPLQSPSQIPSPPTPRQVPQGTKEQQTKQNQIVRNDDVDSTFIDYFPAKKAKLANTSGHDSRKNPRTEALRMFLLSMLPDLECMDDSQVRLFKRRCLQAIDEILMSTPTNLYSFPPASTI